MFFLNICIYLCNVYRLDPLKMSVNLYLKRPFIVRSAHKVPFVIEGRNNVLPRRPIGWPGGRSLLGKKIPEVMCLAPAGVNLSSNIVNFTVLYVYLYPSLWAGVCQFECVCNVFALIYIYKFS